MASSVAGHRRAFGADVVPQCYDDLELADLVVLVGSNAAWCHPDPLPAHPDRTRRARHARRQHRSAPHRDQRRRRPAALHQARHRQHVCGAVLLVRAGRTPGDRPRRSSPRIRKASHAALSAARAPRADTRVPSPPLRGLERAGRRPVLRLVRRHAARRHPATARASTSRRRAPTRSTPSSTATSPRAASASRAPDRCRSPASPTPWAGARSAASPTCWPRTWASRRAERDRVRRFWDGAQSRRRRRPQGRRHVRRRRRRAHQGPVGDGHQPGRLAAARRRGARGARPSSSCWSCRRTSPPTTRCSSRMCACRPRPGARRTARSPTRSGCISRQRAFLPLPGEARPRLVDPERGGAAAGLRRGVRLPLRSRHLRRACTPLGLRERRQARLRHLRRRGPRRSRPTTRWSPSSGRSRDERGATRRACSPTAASSRRTARPASSPSLRRALPPPSRRPGRSCSTPAACATSGTP